MGRTVPPDVDALWKGHTLPAVEWPPKSHSLSLMARRHQTTWTEVILQNKWFVILKTDSVPEYKVEELFRMKKDMETGSQVWFWIGSQTKKCISTFVMKDIGRVTGEIRLRPVDENGINVNLLTFMFGWLYYGCESDLVLRKCILKFGRTTCFQMVHIYIYIYTHIYEYDKKRK